jgi:hypothetical protein
MLVVCVEIHENDDFSKKRWGKTMLTLIFFRPFYAKKLPMMGNFSWLLLLLLKIWTLADIDKDGQLDEEEYALAMYLIEIKLRDDDDVPATLPDHLVPPSKRTLVFGSKAAM